LICTFLYKRLDHCNSAEFLAAEREAKLPNSFSEHKTSTRVLNEWVHIFLLQ